MIYSLLFYLMLENKRTSYLRSEASISMFECFMFDFSIIICITNAVG
jgi:hypothetical protein